MQPDMPTELTKTEAQGEAPPDYGENGVDVTLIHWMLSLTPAERLQVLQQAVSSLERLRRANPVC